MHQGAIQVNFYPILTRQIATVYVSLSCRWLGTLHGRAASRSQLSDFQRTADS